MRVTRLRAIASFSAACVFLVACASAGSSAKDSDRIVPPKIVTRGPLPRMGFRRSAGGALQKYHADIEVVIDSTGAPDMSTFQAHGSAVDGNRDALYEWIQECTFAPGLRNGKPVTAVLHTSLDFRLQGS